MKLIEQYAFSGMDWGLTPVAYRRTTAGARYFGLAPAALEIFDHEYAAGIDQIEVGGRVSGQIRFAFQVEDVQLAMERALERAQAVSSLIRSLCTVCQKNQQIRINTNFSESAIKRR